VVALDANTGKLKWYYQFVHHDIWDYDTPAPPVLIDVVHDGKTIPAIAQITKMGLLFILDRLTGKPIYGAEERPVPKSDVPGEESWPTQPFPLKPVPLARNSFKKDEIATVTPEHQDFCTQMFNTDGAMINNGPYTPFQTKLTLLFPGTAGGGNWGGVSFDPKLGYIFVNTQDLGAVGAMVKEEDGASPAYHKGGTLGPFSRFWDSKKEWPCQQPPWGRLTAVNANTGDVAWQIPFGVVDELEAKGVHNTGSLNAGGSVATAGHLLFIAATVDHRFRAFDSRTGKELWVTKLEAGGHATPITYLGRNGKQYVLITAGGGFSFDHVGSDSVAAFALP
jgi:glucose dehydrogenase